MLIIVLGLFFRICEKVPSSLWTDEFATYWISSAPTISECISRASPTQGQSPFYYILEWFVLKHAPHTENSLRLISLMASLISIGLVFYIAVSIFNKKGRQERSALKENQQEQTPSDKQITESPNHSVILLPAIFASLLFALDINQIYYAQEARPYALAIMFALFSQLFYLKLLEKRSVYIETLYIVSSALIFYTHYIIGTMVLIQNIWALIIICRPGKIGAKNSRQQTSITFMNWCKIQIILIGILFPLLFHLVPILRHSSKWTWLKPGGIMETFSIFGTLFNPPILIMYIVVFILLTIYKFDSGRLTKNLTHRTFHFLLIWLLTPPLFAYSASKFLNTSLLDSRYMILSLIPSYLLAAYFINTLKNQQAKIFLISFILFAYLGGVLIPAFKKEQRFSYRIPHDWRKATAHLNNNIQFGDVIVLRAGYVKENWIPDAINPVICEYVKAPLNSFYFSPILQPANHTGEKHPNISIYNMTYTKEIDFYSYYDTIFDECAKKNRVWIIGVNPPNTNYLVSQLPEILRNSHRKYFEKDFSGVYLVMLKKKL